MEEAKGRSKEDIPRSDEKNWNAVCEYIKTEPMQLGAYYSHTISSDIKHLLISLSRYKFASKMLTYRENVNLLELGCQEGLGALLFQQNLSLKKYVGIDLDKEAIEWGQKHLPDELQFICGNFFDCANLQIEGGFDAVVSLDVIEHISSEMEDAYCEVICTNLKQDGVAIVGTPNIMFNPYASEVSKIGHINLYDQKRLYGLMNRYFHNVFIFNMNDEVVHTGFAPMACYIFALCCNKR